MIYPTEEVPEPKPIGGFYSDIDPNEPVVEARFILRSAATHKVTLNVRIFKEMIVGDHKGGEPPKKTELLFSAAGEKGLEIYLLRVSLSLCWISRLLILFADGEERRLEDIVGGSEEAARTHLSLVTSLVVVNVSSM